jgi:hypothetical protein
MAKPLVSVARRKLQEPAAAGLSMTVTLSLVLLLVAVALPAVVVEAKVLGQNAAQPTLLMDPASADDTRDRRARALAQRWVEHAKLQGGLKMRVAETQLLIQRLEAQGAGDDQLGRPRQTLSWLHEQVETAQENERRAAAAFEGAMDAIRARLGHAP